MWLYASSCIRIVNTRSDSVSHSLSTIYIVNRVANQVVDSFCLSICHVPLEQLKAGHKFYVSAPHLHGDGDVIWLDASIVALAPVFKSSKDPLYEYIKYALHNGFNFLPLDTLVGNSVLLALNLIKVLCRSVYSTENSLQFREFTPVTVEQLTSIVVRSSPFNFTNASIFSDFASTGNINYVLKNGNGCYGYLSDIKYLENMSGAMVTTRNNKSVGLLLGNLRKLNGDGDLLIIVPWERLLALVPNLKAEFSCELSKAWSLQVQETSKHQKIFDSVLPIVLFKGENSLSWGSCVLLNLHTLVTNFHVIKPFCDSEDIHCQVITRDSTVVKFGKDDEVIVPFENLDLAFISLSDENQALLATIKPTLMAFANTLQVGDVVYSSGYGLIFNRDYLNPLKSSGHVSSKVYQRPFESSPKIPCMLIASSSCWNGSSGGGLFNERGCLVGLICSNAQVFVPSVNGRISSKTEKVPLFCLCIPLELILECYRVKVVERQQDVRLYYKVEKTWKLECYHQDLFEREMKL